MTLQVPNQIINDTPADAVPIDANYRSIEQYVNTNMVNRDGSIAMTGQLVLVGDPVSDNQAVRKAYVDAVLPVGVMLPWLGIAAPAGLWALANGAALQSTAYPDLFNVIGQRFGGTGGSFNLPQMAGRVPIGVHPTQDRFNATGKTGGSYTAVAPAHTHTINHDHGSAASAGAGARHTHAISHQHTINHDHGAFDTADAGSHYHDPSDGDGFFAYNSGATGDNLAIINSPATATKDSQTAAATSTAPAHKHSVNVPGFNGSSGWNSVGSSGNDSPDHTHQVNLPAFNGASGSTGTANAEQIPPFVVINYIVRIA